MHPLDRADLYVGLTGIDVPTGSIELGEGLDLTSTHAKFLTPLTLVNTSMSPTDAPARIRPAYWQSATRERVITAQLFVPKSLADSFETRFELARFVVLVLRLWSDPGIGLHVLSSHRFEKLCDLPDSDRPILLPVETQPRYFALGTVDPQSVVPSLSWVQENWRTAYSLYSSSSEFRLAADSLDSGQFIPNNALILLALWGSLEALFSPSTTELKFRVSALIAAYLEPLGANRLALQKRVAGLYDMRSAAAHGRNRHEPEHLLQTFELLRSVIIRMIYNKSVPSKEFLELKLFGVE